MTSGHLDSGCWFSCSRWWRRWQRLDGFWRDGASQFIQHRPDGSHARHGFFAELPTVGVGADHFAMDEYGASAHAGDDFRHLQPRMIRLDKNEVLVGEEVGEHTDDFHIEAFGFGARKDRQTVSFVARLELLNIEKGRCWSRGLRRFELGKRCTKSKSAGNA